MAHSNKEMAGSNVGQQVPSREGHKGSVGMSVNKEKLRGSFFGNEVVAV